MLKKYGFAVLVLQVIWMATLTGYFPESLSSGLRGGVAVIGVIILLVFIITLVITFYWWLSLLALVSMVIGIAVFMQYYQVDIAIYPKSQESHDPLPKSATELSIIPYGEVK